MKTDDDDASGDDDDEDDTTIGLGDLKGGRFGSSFLALKTS